MEKELQQKFLVKLEELIITVKNDSIYKTYTLLSDKMKSHPEIPSIISNIRNLQKAAVKEESFSNYEKVAEIDKEIEKYFEKLRNFPLYLDFLEVQGELDEVFQFIKEQIQIMMFS